MSDREALAALVCGECLHVGLDVGMGFLAVVLTATVLHAPRVLRGMRSLWRGDTDRLGLYSIVAEEAYLVLLELVLIPASLLFACLSPRRFAAALVVLVRAVRSRAPGDELLEPPMDFLNAVAELVPRARLRNWTRVAWQARALVPRAPGWVAACGACPVLFVCGYPAAAGLLAFCGWYAALPALRKMM